MAVLTAPHKTDGSGLPQLRAHAHAAAAEHAVTVSERVADFLHAAEYGHILDGAGIGGLSHEKLRDVVPQFSYFFGVRAYNHAFLHEQGAGGGDSWATLLDVFNDAETAGTEVGEIGHMTQVWNTDAKFDGHIEHTCSFHRAHVGAINRQGHELLHSSPL